jgi:hypothetical protein
MATCRGGGARKRIGHLARWPRRVARCFPVRRRVHSAVARAGWASARCCGSATRDPAAEVQGPAGRLGRRCLVAAHGCARHRAGLPSAHRGPAQRAQCAGRHRLRPGGGREPDAIVEGAGSVRTGGRTLAGAGVAGGRPCRHPGRRQLQRQPGLGAGRHRRAGRAARPAPAGAGRHGRSGRARPGLSPGGAAPRPGAWHRVVHCGDWMRQATAAMRRRWRGQPALVRCATDARAIRAGGWTAATGAPAACWSRVRASCAWSAWCRRCRLDRQQPTQQQEDNAHAA